MPIGAMVTTNCAPSTLSPLPVKCSEISWSAGTTTVNASVVLMPPVSRMNMISQRRQVATGAVSAGVAASSAAGIMAIAISSLPQVPPLERRLYR